MTDQFEDGGNRELRRDDDTTTPVDEETTGNPYHLPWRTRTFLRIVALVLVVTMTALFLRGFINS